MNMQELINTYGHNIMSREQLRDELSDGLSLTVQGLQKAASAAIHLQKLGEDLDDVPMARFFLRIGAGLMVPETLLACARRPALLSRMSQLPIEVQKDILDGKPIEFATADFQTVPLSPLDMEPPALAQVFDCGRIRNVKEQIHWLRSRAVPPKAQPGVQFKVDHKRERVIVKSVGVLSFNQFRRIAEQVGVK